MVSIFFHKTKFIRQVSPNDTFTAVFKIGRICTFWHILTNFNFYGYPYSIASAKNSWRLLKNCLIYRCSRNRNFSKQQILIYGHFCGFLEIFWSSTLRFELWAKTALKIPIIPYIWAYSFFCYNPAIFWPIRLKFFMGTQETIIYRLVMRNYDFTARASRPDRKVVPLGGTFESTVISKNRLKKLGPEHPPP